MEQKSKYISTQSNKPHAFHVQINIIQNASSLEKDGKRDIFMSLNIRFGYSKEPSHSVVLILYISVNTGSQGHFLDSRSEQRIMFLA